MLSSRIPDGLQISKCHLVAVCSSVCSSCSLKQQKQCKNPLQTTKCRKMQDMIFKLQFAGLKTNTVPLIQTHIQPSLLNITYLNNMAFWYFKNWHFQLFFIYKSVVLNFGLIAFINISAPNLEKQDKNVLLFRMSFHVVYYQILVTVL